MTVDKGGPDMTAELHGHIDEYGGLHITNIFIREPDTEQQPRTLVRPTLCPNCKGNTVVGIPGGIATCHECMGRGEVFVQGDALTVEIPK